MATPEEKATELKNQGNKAFAAHDWPTAIDLYSQAIELNGKEPTFWSNRAQVRATPPSALPTSASGRVTDHVPLHRPT
jgi:hypothetical protein